MSDAWGGSWGAPSAWDVSWGDAAVEPPVVEVVTSPTGGGIPRRRRRYIMPDGTMLEATTQEAYEWLRLYSRPASVETAPKRSVQGAVRTPQIVLEKSDVRFIPATDAAADTWKAVISERFTFKAPAQAAGLAQERLNRIRADNEALIALLM